MVKEKERESVLIDRIHRRGWTITIDRLDIGWFIRGHAGNKNCCDSANTCRRCSVPIEYDPQTGHGYSEFDSSSDMTSMDGHGSLDYAIEWARDRLAFIVPGAEK